MAKITNRDAEAGCAAVRGCAPHEWPPELLGRRAQPSDIGEQPTLAVCWYPPLSGVIYLVDFASERDINPARLAAVVEKSAATQYS